MTTKKKTKKPSAPAMDKNLGTPAETRVRPPYTGPRASMQVFKGEIPDLYLRRGNAIAKILPEQCYNWMKGYVNGRGFSQMRDPSLKLHNIKGEVIGHISYNGRVWLHSPTGDQEVPVKGMLTCAECEARGWQ